MSLSALSPETWCFDLAWIPQNAYLVGGAVRDAILKRESEYLDLDFVLPDVAVQVARKIASHYKAGFVLLDSDRQIARVVFKQATVDFAQQQGERLIDDLHRRDFTINAIAYSPHTQEFIDPLKGCNDLQQRIIRMVSPANLQDDPLRLLRAYRQAAQLGFEIEAETQAAIVNFAPLLSNIAAERVRVELGYLLNSSMGSRGLISAWQDGLLKTWFANTERSHLSKLALIDASAITLKQLPLSQPLSDTIKTTWLGIAKLACLVTHSIELAEIELQQLTYSRAEIRAVTTVLKLLPQLQATAGDLSLKEQYLLFRQAGVVFPALAVLAAANGMSKADLTPLTDRYLNPTDPVAHPQLLVNGKDLMQALQIAPSPLVGELLNKIAIAQIEGKISTPIQAIDLAATLLKSAGTIDR
ncbi:CCA tRNA nucleotidyltransferase [Aliterella atlantica]|uniref:Poly(A) polymerase n=1 Tax=Aliterella atlantica CENA595 TaxID=1618023 RepID=A0A0D8ZYD0_9CYAN|nr:CCA tRNA nucleotidyltransferase [Aliterella atlantica]KJH73469.1 poly(A) polymerase [Aliterella atlantica CENA595]